MKTYRPYIIIICLFCFYQISIAQQLIDYHIHNVNNMWYKTFYRYDNQNNIIATETMISSNKIDWTNHSCCNITYNNENISKKYNYVWAENAWQECKSEEYTYLGNIPLSYTVKEGTQTTIIEYNYNGNNITETHKIFNNEELIYSTVSVKNSINNQLSKVKCYSLSATGDTIYSQKSNIKYYGDNIETISYEMSNSQYMPYHKSVVLKKNDKIMSEIQYTLNDTTWTPLSKQIYSYNLLGNITNITYMYWSNRFWVSNYQRNYYYDNNTLKQSQISSLTYNLWSPNFTIDYEYNDNGNTIAAYLYRDFWGENNVIYTDYVSISSNQTTPKEIYCNEIEISYKNSNDDVIVNDIIIESQISTYPNPSRTGLFFFHSDYDIISIKVYDLNGSELLSNNNTSFLDLSSLTNGVYIARITTENNIHTEKLILNQ